MNTCKLCHKQFEPNIILDKEKIPIDGTVKYCSWDCRVFGEILKNIQRPVDRQYQKWQIHKKIPLFKHPALIRCIYRIEDEDYYNVVNHFGRKCKLCLEDRIINACHLIPARFGGKLTNDNIIILCPNHHFLLDHNKLNEEEKHKIVDIIERDYKDARYILHFLDLKHYELPLSEVKLEEMLFTIQNKRDTTKDVLFEVKDL